MWLDHLFGPNEDDIYYYESSGKSKIKSKSSSKEKDKKRRKSELAEDKKSRVKDPQGGSKSHNRHRPTSSARYGSQFHLCLVFHCVNPYKVKGQVDREKSVCD